MIIKICGIKTIEAAQVAAEKGADFIGFIFAPSKRQISPALAKTITSSLPPSVKKVGVFVNETVEKMEQITKEVGLDFVQLHGDESAEIAKQLSAKVIRAYSSNHLAEADFSSYPCDYLLMDSPGEAYRGGSGKVFDWSLLDTLAVPREKVILAGGLSSENVEQAIKLVSPAGIDVSSNVETNGRKDHEKIKQFIQAARYAEHQIDKEMK
ncbi:phosphoribosylanthranilate isomerase [Ornithinibacillus sp. 4-3]|uniref:N-(5'-phosphoribosyl)anthranilate isomerase n=1 Tax=Ornithinibacillus sp. 4-3 TaxID=3231488 RepID=A0AB39HPZ8_9BACI